jgi:hypothetical protein
MQARARLGLAQGLGDGPKQSIQFRSLAAGKGTGSDPFQQAWIEHRKRPVSPDAEPGAVAGNS